MTYVPQFVKDEIRAQVRDELRQEVAQDVIDRARQEQWGVPAALPDWVARLKFKGDLRLRAQSDRFADGNAQFAYFDFLEINDAGGLADAGVDGLLNTTEDRDRLRARVRLGLDARITDSLLAGFRLSTGNTRDPVSTNQTPRQHWQPLRDGAGPGLPALPGARRHAVADRARRAFRQSLAVDRPGVGRRSWLRGRGGHPAPRLRRRGPPVAHAVPDRGRFPAAGGGAVLEGQVAVRRAGRLRLSRLPTSRA